MIAAPELRTFPGMRFSGIKAEMSFARNTTFELWRAFMQERKNIPDTAGSDLYSIEIYPQGFFDPFSRENTFEKWAAVPVTAAPDIQGFDSLEIPEGHYAVFLHRGPASEGEKTYRHIFEQWLPQSGFVLANRPHFAIMGTKYKADSPDSEEEIWIPVQPI